MTGLHDLETPCLLLDRSRLERNLARMAAAAARHGVALRPHLKTAKSAEVAKLATAGQAGGITVSTLAEAAYFARAGFLDMIYAVGITPRRLNAVAALNAAGADVKVITDDLDVARAIAAHPGNIPALIEVDCGEHRGGLAPDDPVVAQIAAALGGRLAGVLTHAGHSYAGRSIEDMAEIAEAERGAVVAAAERLRGLGHAVGIVSMGSSPTVLYARHLDGITEARPGVYMFGDLFQAGIFTLAEEDIAVSVLASVVGRRPKERALVLDAGGMALSKDRATSALPQDRGFGLLLDADGTKSFGEVHVERAYQEHGIAVFPPGVEFPDLKVGALVRILPNHVCMTAAAHDRYHVLDEAGGVAAEWPRMRGWAG